jgi:superfamily II DNA/RNA helicase
MTNQFEAFGLPPKLLQSLKRMQFDTPTPVQMQTIPLAMKGQDVLGSAQTGTGKTGAFGIPIIAHLMAQPVIGALIMTPTRELATQVQAALQQMNPTQDIRSALLIGGDPMPKQFRQLQQNPRIIIGTPGRINDHLLRGTLKLNNIKILVLDETDRMLDMGFGVQIDKIVHHLPKERQTMMFSATLPANIVKMSSKYMHNPARVAVGSTTTPLARIKQELIQTTEGEKYPQLLEQLKTREGSVIIFVKMKHGTERLAERLSKAGHLASAIHGDLRQRRRDSVIREFRDKKFRILVATDVAARGLDIPHIEHVINFDLPQCPEDYIHRVGRTARAGAEGAAVNLLTPADYVKWRAIHKLIHGDNAPPFRGNHPDAPAARSGRGGRGGFGGKFAGRRDNRSGNDNRNDRDRPRGNNEGGSAGKPGGGENRSNKAGFKARKRFHAPQTRSA